MTVSVILPAYNEENALSMVIEEILHQNTIDEIFIVDDGSTDNTYRIAEDYSKSYEKVKIFRHKQNLGKVAALHTGIKNSSGDILILTDADLSYPASVFSKMILEIENGSDLVLGSRFMGGVRNMPLVNQIGNQVLSLIVSYVTGIRISDSQTGLRAFRKENFESLDVDANGLEYETKMTVRAAKLGYKITEIPLEYRKRIGESKLSPLRDGYRMFLSIFQIMLSETSLRSKTILIPSVILFFIGFAFGLISLYDFFSYGRPIHPYYPLITVLFIIVGVQLFSIGLITDNMSKKIEFLMRKLK